MLFLQNRFKGLFLFDIINMALCKSKLLASLSSYDIRMPREYSDHPLVSQVC